MNFPGTAGSGIGNVPGTRVRPNFYGPGNGSGNPGDGDGGGSGIGFNSNIPYYGGGGGGYSSPYGGTWYTSGLADMIRSYGSYNLDTSRAAINVEEAREEYIQNRDMAQKIWFAMKERNEAYRAAEEGPRVTSEQLFRLNAQRAPERLNDSQYDPITGELYWPAVLRAASYQPYREVIDRSYKTRASAGSFANYQSHVKTVQAADQMYDLLKERVRDYSPQEYVDANVFMKALVYDVRFPSS